MNKILILCALALALSGCVLKKEIKTSSQDGTRTLGHWEQLTPILEGGNGLYRYVDKEYGYVVYATINGVSAVPVLKDR